MLIPLIEAKVRDESTFPAPPPLTEETEFYQQHAWCLNPHLTAFEAHRRLGEELTQLQGARIAWQRAEAAVNVWLLGSAILNAADERLRGKALKLPALLASRGPVYTIQAAAARLAREDRGLRRWRNDWSAALQAVVPLLLPVTPPSADSAIAMSRSLRELIEAQLPGGLVGERLGLPSPFQRLDLTHHDVIALAERLITHNPDRTTRFALIGLRTSGTYFVPLIKASLEAAGYCDVELATLEPSKGASRAEMQVLEGFAAQGRVGVLVDDPPDTGGTVFAAIGVARAAGFGLDRLRVLVPTHSATRHWADDLPHSLVVTLAPEDWHKASLLQPDLAEAALGRYFLSARIIASKRAAEFTSNLHSSSPDLRIPRLKRVYEVETETTDGRFMRVFVLAKSVGCGWLSYSAYLAAHRLAGCVPPLLGLRDGILYSLYIPWNSTGEIPDANTVATYVATRVHSLGLADSAANMNLKRRNNGVRLLEKALSRGYGGALIGTLMRERIGARLRALPCPIPTWIDGNNCIDEWIAAPDGWLKTDFEHHGLGKGSPNVVDPAFDLATALIELGLTKDEERDFIATYVDCSGDTKVLERLFVNKLMAGLWSMNRAQEAIFGAVCGAKALQMASRRFISAWHSLTVETARYAGRFCRTTPPTALRAPLVFLDIDGVIDRRVFGFPATTAAGIRALAALNRHPCSVVLNTARSVAEVKAYCEAYGLAGGVAEYGSYIWDAVRGEGRTLIDAATMQQMERLRGALSRIPGVFLDERHHYSIRAFTFREKPDGMLAGLLQSVKAADIGDGAVAPLSPILVKQVMDELALNRLRVHHTTIDTTIVGRNLDKGTGLAALRNWAVGPHCETVAVGDSEADLTMFRAATRSFAPGNISCAHRAQVIGCEIVPQWYQAGLLEIARRLGATKQESKFAPEASLEQDRLMFEIFTAADASWTQHALRALRDPKCVRIFLR